MKRLFLIILMTLPVLGRAQTSNFTIKASVANLSAPTKVYLTYQVPGKFILDSAMSDRGAFEFQGTVPYPLKAQIWLDHQGVGIKKPGKNADVLTLFLDKDAISINAPDSIKNSVITGSRINTEYIKYKALLAKPMQEMAAISVEEGAIPADQTDQERLIELKGKFQKAADDKKALQYQFIKQNPNSEFSLGALYEIAGPTIDVAAIEPIYNSLSADIRNSTPGQQFAKSIEIARNTVVGSMAPAFTQNDVNNKSVSLIDFRGKYVLLDFWASWCGPCRAENPNVVKAYSHFKDKNFDVLAISLDEKRENWLKAVKADDMPWTQLSDLKGWNNAVAKQYDIKSIPKNFLIDPNGVIIATNLRGDALEKKLEEILDTKKVNN
jgi:peroxiredoxin